jgi:transcription elongation factor GreB
MSKAFTKDDDAGEAPILVARRAPLPSGSPNYVTERGLGLLRAELARELERGAARTQSMSDAESARSGARHAAQVAEIEARISSAVLVESRRQPRGEVRFGARVRVRNSAGSERTYRIVGVDEADAASGDVAFVAPLARSLLGKRIGDVALVHSPAGGDELEVLAIEYD